MMLTISHRLCTNGIKGGNW